jgi:hypothetical protein
MLKKLHLIFLVFLFAFPCFGMKFYLDDPVAKDTDQHPVPQPKEIKAGVIYDLVKNTLFRPGKQDPNKRKAAANVNTLGEVPDSSWFTNRIGIREISQEELAQGPSTLKGPEPNGEWTVIQAKSQGVTPGFTIRDINGEIFFLKFDPKKNPQLATSAEVVATKFFHAFGYNVPENYVAFLNPSQLRIDPEAILTDENGQRRRMRQGDVSPILKRVPQRADGTVQVIASRRIPGILLGPFKYYGTRNDDANDIFPHEDRRELRAMRVLASWVNDDERTRINTLDSYQGEPGKGYVKHYLIDFGSSFGSASIEPNELRTGNEYFLEKGPILKSALTFGLLDRPWRSVHYPEYPSVGRFESQFFEPQKWKPDYPNPAFEKMTPQDAFWATRIVMKFSDDAIRSLVKTGQYEDPGAEDYLARTLVERRDKIIRYYLSLLPPLDEFQWSGNFLQFKNLGVERQIGTVEGYRYQWFRLDNASETLQSIAEPTTISSTSIDIPQYDTEEYLMARIEPVNPSISGWSRNVDVYLRISDQRVVGVDRP